MYEQVGKKIMTLAKIMGVLWIIIGIAGWLVCITNRLVWIQPFGWVILILCAICFMSTWMIYGFGQIIDDVRGILWNSNKKPGAYVTAQTIPVAAQNVNSVVTHAAAPVTPTVAPGQTVYGDIPDL